MQVTANQMFKRAFDPITSKILEEEPDEYQEFVQLTRQVRCETAARLYGHVHIPECALGCSLGTHVCGKGAIATRLRRTC